MLNSMVRTLSNPGWNQTSAGGVQRLRVLSLSLGIKNLLFVSILMISWSSSAVALPESAEDRARLAVEIALRVDLAVDPGLAATRHLLVRRASLAIRRHQNTQPWSIAEQWLEWQLALMPLKDAAASEGTSVVGHYPASLDAVDAILRPSLIGQLDQMPSSWPPEGLEDMALSLYTQTPQSLRLTPHQQRHMMQWAHAHAPWFWGDFLDQLQREPELIPLILPLIDPWLPLSLDAPIEEWRSLDDSTTELLQSLETPSDWGVLMTDTVDRLFHQALPGGQEMQVRNRLLPYRAYVLGRDDPDRTLRWMAVIAAVNQSVNGEYLPLLDSLWELANQAESCREAESCEQLRILLEQLDILNPEILPALTAINTQWAGVYQQLRQLLRERQQPSQSSPQGGADLAAIQTVREKALVDLRVLLDMGQANIDRYLMQPLRRSIIDDVAACYVIGQQPLPLPSEPITDGQFKRCIEAFSRWAADSAAQVELTGRGSGPYEIEHLNRELRLLPWQRINYWGGFAERTLATDCNLPDDQIVNPFEWSMAVRSLVWFASQWPHFVASGAMQPTVEGLREKGQDLLGYAAALRQCRDASGLEAAAKLIEQYRQEVARLSTAIERSTQDFRSQVLREQSDIQLGLDAAQSTDYRPTELTIGPCDVARSCGMTRELPSTRALFGLFPGELLVAHQIQLGTLSICYDQVEWVDRRAVVPDNGYTAMANYFGTLSYKLVGRFDGINEPIFEMPVLSHREYEYLFGANTDEVLEAFCPRDLFETQVTSQLPEDRFNLVPRRLTFLTTARTVPSDIFSEHWADGDEWRDWFDNDESSLMPVNEALREEVDTRLAELYGQWNSELYAQLLGVVETGENGQGSLSGVMMRLQIYKSALQTYLRLFDPVFVETEQMLAALLNGENGLPDRRVVLAMQNDEKPVTDLVGLAIERTRLAAQLLGAHSQMNGAGTGDMITRTLLMLELVERLYRQ